MYSINDAKIILERSIPQLTKLVESIQPVNYGLILNIKRWQRSILDLITEFEAVQAMDEDRRQEVLKENEYEFMGQKAIIERQFTEITNFFHYDPRLDAQGKAKAQRALNEIRAVYNGTKQEIDNLCENFHHFHMN